MANPKNVQIRDTLKAAKATGFRPFRRCNPDGPAVDAGNAVMVAKARRLIEQAEQEPSLSDLAKAVNRSPGYFHRLFKSVTGVTPKDFASGQRAARVRVSNGSTVTEAIYDARFNSSGRCSEKSNEMLGMTPSRYRASSDEEICFAVGNFSLGTILASSKKALLRY
jgi:AraC family transcriptional regulator, regulatory protein of adaptative response / methylated-DNA-[protein]-cysteine methyltransferase